MVEKQLRRNELENHSLTQVSAIRIDKSKPAAIRMEEYLNKVKNPSQLLCGDVPVELLFAPPDSPSLSALAAGCFISKKGDN